MPTGQVQTSEWDHGHSPCEISLQLHGQRRLPPSLASSRGAPVCQRGNPKTPTTPHLRNAYGGVCGTPMQAQTVQVISVRSILVHTLRAPTTRGGRVHCAGAFMSASKSELLGVTTIQASYVRTIFLWQVRKQIQSTSSFSCSITGNFRQAGCGSPPPARQFPKIAQRQKAIPRNMLGVAIFRSTRQTRPTGSQKTVEFAKLVEAELSAMQLPLPVCQADWPEDATVDVELLTDGIIALHWFRLGAFSQAKNKLRVFSRAGPRTYYVVFPWGRGISQQRGRIKIHRIWFQLNIEVQARLAPGFVYSTTARHQRIPH